MTSPSLRRAAAYQCITVTLARLGQTGGRRAPLWNWRRWRRCTAMHRVATCSYYECYFVSIWTTAVLALTHLITFWKFHRLSGVNWKIFGTVPVLGTFLRNLETPFGGAVHRSDETHKVLRSAFPFMVCDFQFLSNSQHTDDQNTRLCCVGIGDPRRRSNQRFGSVAAVNWKETGNCIP